jgi:hypothetical protein
MTVLVYVGIRMVMSSIASEKAKYKAMMQDWVIAMLLLFVLHYIMYFTITIIERITVAIAGKSHMVVVIIPSDDLANKVTGYASEQLQAIGINPERLIHEEDGHKYVLWPTNFIGAARVDTQTIATRVVAYDEADQTVEKVEQDDQRTLIQKAANTIIYMVLVIFTLMYLFFYIKRLIYLAFLTLIAPLITLTYPIDKISDGQAQGFNVWIKEYVFNMLIQPFHLILYYILIGSAMEFAKDNLVYTIVALGFMLPAENLLRKMFNFQKAETAKAFSGAAGGALAMAGIQNLAKIAGIGKGGKGGGSGKDGGKGNDGATPPRTRTLNPPDVDGNDNPPPDDNNEPPPDDDRPLLGDEDAPEERDDPTMDPEVQDYMNSDEYREWMQEGEDQRDEDMAAYQEFLDSDDNVPEQMEDMAEEDAAEDTAAVAAVEEKRRMSLREMAAERQAKLMKIRETAFDKLGELTGKDMSGLKGRLTGIGRVLKRADASVMSNLPKYTRAVGGAMLGGAGAILGGATGIASGSFSGAIKNAGAYGGAGAAIGTGLGGVAGRVAQSTTSGSFTGSIDRGVRRIGAEYRAGQIQESEGRIAADRYVAKETKQDSEEYDKYMQANYDNLSVQEEREMKSQWAQMEIDTGETDIKRLDKAVTMANQLEADMRSRNEGQPENRQMDDSQIRSRAEDMAAYALKEAKGMTKQDTLDSDKIKNLRKKVFNQSFDFYNNGQRTEEEARQLANGWADDVVKRAVKLIN